MPWSSSSSSSHVSSLYFSLLLFLKMSNSRISKPWSQVHMVKSPYQCFPTRLRTQLLMRQILFLVFQSLVFSIFTLHILNPLSLSLSKSLASFNRIQRRGGMIAMILLRQFSLPPEPLFDFDMPPLPSTVGDGSNGSVSSDRHQNLAISPIVFSVIFLIVFSVIVYKLSSKKAASIFKRLRYPAPNMDPAVIWEADAPTMQKFFREIAEVKLVTFTAQQLCAFTSNYSTRLGSGGFGEVYKGQFPNGANIAVKVLKRNSDTRAKEEFMAEVGTICRTYHINLVRLYGFCYDNFMSALVFEYMENGSLDKYLFSKRETIEWGKLHDIAIGTARGLAYLHEECQQRIIHYDIKPANILLDANFFPKVGDFGLAKLCNRDNTHISMSGFRGTFGYSAPEFLLTNYSITHKCDVYSFGMVLFEIVGRKSNGGTTVSGNPDWFPQNVWDAYENGKLEELIVGCGIGEEDREKASRACEVALWCVQDSPNERPPMSAVVKMLEGGVEIKPPPKPFQYLNTIRMGTNGTSLEQTNIISSEFSTNNESNSQWYEITTSVTRKCEIQMASS